MEIKIIKAPPVVTPPDTFCLTGNMEELSFIKTCVSYYAQAPLMDLAGDAKRLVAKLPGPMYSWNDASKLFLP